MKRFLTRVTFAAIFILLPCLADTAKACSCLPIPPPYESFKGAAAVFVGKVTGSTDVPATERIGEKEFTYHERHYRFTVEEAFKGGKGGEVTVSAGRTDSSCFVGFEVGSSYLVYAAGQPGSLLYAHMCSRTSGLAGAQDDIHYIRQLLRGVPEPRVYGSVVRYDTDFSKSLSVIYTPLEGIRIVVEGGGRRFEAVTDKRGLFSLANVPDGEYKARPVMPDRYGRYWPAEQEFVLGTAGEYTAPNVHQGPAAYAGFSVGWNNLISGRILDADGNPIERAKASLLLYHGPTETPLVLSEERSYLPRGEYGFSGLTPGRFLPSVSIRAPFFKPDGKPTRFYFPGVADLAQASEITVGEKDSLTGRDIRLPAGYVLRPVTGVVVREDGSRVENAWVFLAESEHSADDDKKYDWESTDVEGRFTLEGFVGAEYWVHAILHKEELKAAPVKIEVKKVNEPLKVIVPSPKQ